MSEPLLERIEALAADVGRLRRRIAPGDVWLVDRVAAHVETVDCICFASAAELVRAGVDLDQALALVDRRAAQLRALLGGPVDVVSHRRARSAERGSR